MSIKYIQDLFWKHTKYPRQIVVSLKRWEEYKLALNPQEQFVTIGEKRSNRMFKGSSILFDEELKDDEFKVVM